MEGAHTESRCDDRVLAALDNLSLRTLSKNFSSLLVKNFSIERSPFELSTERSRSLETKSCTTSPSASVNCVMRGLKRPRTRNELVTHTVAMALLRGESVFSSTIDAIDSTEEARE